MKVSEVNINDLIMQPINCDCGTYIVLICAPLL